MTRAVGMAERGGVGDDRGVELTYPEVGATRGEDLPAGYRHVRRHAQLGTGEAVFRRAAGALARWEMQRGTGMAVRANAPVAAVGVEIASGVGLGRVRLWAPCRIVWLDDTDRRYGYAYGTLPGHPERGEEAFVLTLDDADRVWFDIRAFSRPGRWFVALGRPAGHLVQDFYTDRYVATMRRLAA